MDGTKPEPPEEPPTLGDPTLPPPRPGAGSYVGPAEDPDRFELMAEGLTGGEGTTWQVRYQGNLTGPLPSAVKRLNPPAGIEAWPSPADLSRWQDQLVVLGYLDSPHIVKLHEVFVGPPPHQAGASDPTARPEAYLRMEWVEGPTLARELRGRPATTNDVERRLTFVGDVAGALEGLHSRTRSGGNPSLHRDVTPANCILTTTRGVVLIDLSTMRPVADGADPAGLHTPAYTAPEVLADPHSARDPSCDLYSLGALAYFCLTGEDPPTARLDGMLGFVSDRVTGEARRLGVAAPEDLAAHVVAMLDPRPVQRPSDMVGWSERLVELGRPAPGRRPRRRVLVAAGAVVALAVGAGLGGWTAFGPESGDGAAADLVGARPTSASTVSLATGAFTSPGEGSGVPGCSIFGGTMSLPAGTTAIITQTPEDYPLIALENVDEWQSAPERGSWRSALYFDKGTIGSTFRIDLVVVSQADLEPALAASKTEDQALWFELPSKGTVLDSLEVVRRPGEVAVDCWQEILST